MTAWTVEVYCAEPAHLRQSEAAPRRAVIARFDRVLLEHPEPPYRDTALPDWDWHEQDVESARQRSEVAALQREPLAAPERGGRSRRDWQQDPGWAAYYASLPPDPDKPSTGQLGRQGPPGWRAPLPGPGQRSEDVARHRLTCKLCGLSVIAKGPALRLVLDTLATNGLSSISLAALAPRLRKQ